MSNEDLIRQVEGRVADIERLERLVMADGPAQSEDIEWLTDTWGVDCDPDGDEYDVQEAAQMALDEMPLDFYQNGTRRPGGEWESTGYVVVFTTGGPHIEMVDGREMVGYWGGDRVRRSIESDYFDHLLDNF